MSNSVFAGLHNAVLVFQVATSEIHTDPATGNKRSVTGTIEFKVMLKQPSQNPTTIEQSGADRTRILLNGYAIEPMHFPSSIGVGSRAQCTIKDSISGHEQSGEFELTALLQTPFTAVTEVLGSHFQGILKLDNAGGIIYG